MPTALEILTDDVDDACMAALGETISYAANGSTYADTLAYVDYRDGVRPLDIGQMVAQDILVTILKTDLAAKPTSTARLTLPRLTGATFKPINVRSDESGTHWEFDVQQVSA